MKLLLVYLNGNNAGEDNVKYANSYSMNSEELICTRHLNRYDGKSIEIVIRLGALWE